MTFPVSNSKQPLRVFSIWKSHGQLANAAFLFTITLMGWGNLVGAEPIEPGNLTISPSAPSQTWHAPRPLNPNESVSFTVTVEPEGSINKKNYKLDTPPEIRYSGYHTLWSPIGKSGNTFQFQALYSGGFVGTDSVTVSATWKEVTPPPTPSTVQGAGAGSSAPQPLDTISGWASGFAAGGNLSFTWTFDPRLQFADGQSPIAWTVSADNQGSAYDLGGATIMSAVGTVHLGSAPTSSSREGTVTATEAQVGVGALEINFPITTARSEKQIGFALPDLEIATSGNGVNLAEDRLPNGGSASSPHEMNPGSFVIAPTSAGGSEVRSKLTLKGKSNSLDGTFTLKAANLANVEIYTSPTGSEKINLPRTWKSAELPSSLYVGAKPFSSGSPAQDGTLTLTYKQTLLAGPSDFQLDDSVRVRLVPVELKVDKAMLTLLEENTLKVENASQFPNGLLSGVKFEIKRDGQTTWYEIQNGAAAEFKGKARVAGKFKVRANLNLNGLEARTGEKSIEVQFPDAATILAGGGVKARMDQAWNDSIAYANATRLREDGYYITLNTETEQYGIVAFSHGADFPSDHSVQPITWTTGAFPRPADSVASPTPLSRPTYTTAWFHTHPVATWIAPPLGRPVGPSSDDHAWSSHLNIQLPGYVYDYVGNTTIVDLLGNSKPAILGGSPKNEPAKIYNITPPARRPTP